jgi:hypothetical protein
LGGRSRLLNEADGLDWPTLCACDLILAVDKAELKDRHGRAWKQCFPKCLVTGDDDLLVLQSVRGMSILTPRQFSDFVATHTQP